MMTHDAGLPHVSRRRLLQSLLSAATAGAVLAWSDRVAASPDGEWRSLFDGQSLGQWKPTEFGGEGVVKVEDGRIILAMGGDLTGVTWTGEVPTVNYEIELQATRLAGGDFFCGLTFPVKASHCSFIVGGWAGTVVGLSSINGMDASENSTTVRRKFENERWYTIRVRVTESRIQAWIDDEQLVDVDTTGKKIGVRAEVLDSRPLGIASWRTKAALRSIRLRSVTSA